uniref:Uncharacterized protein n=1 Tax=Meloidogyne hapla TaxID=6305 RepID=A0A1I8BWN0_MELHA
MRHCGICSGGNPSFQNGPYAGLCQKVYKQCINELLILDEQWRIFIVEKTLLQIQKTVAYLVKQNEELFLLIAIRQRNVENNEKNNSEEEKVINYWDEEWDVERLERSKVKRNGSATVTCKQDSKCYNFYRLAPLALCVSIDTRTVLGKIRQIISLINLYLIEKEEKPNCNLANCANYIIKLMRILGADCGFKEFNFGLIQQ